MKYQLKDFQERAATEVLKRLDLARQGASAGVAQAIVLSSPTGSGKTVTIAAVLERFVRGDTEREANTRACILWISDSPELNLQSRDKVARASDAFPYQRLVTIDADFDAERFAPGSIYFVNISKLGKEKLLTTHGDGRTWTFWETVANTISLSGADFIVVIDEAHRGMSQSAQDRNRAKSIVQKLIFGSPSDRLPEPGVPIILGMSATPQRFDELLEGTERTKNSVRISVDDVRESGLLKDLILVHVPMERTPGDQTLLEEATRRWAAFNEQWEDYCLGQNIALIVRPVLVVQVEDGDPQRGVLSKTNLDEAVRTIERVAGTLSGEDYAHCFQEDGVVEAGGRKIRHVDPSRIQDEPWVRVVFFKMSLTTGWDCPRAEVMMSFRRARDSTLIAQLVGRMIRTPLARRVEGSELLNTVELFLPNYDPETVESILQELENPDADSGLGARATVASKVQIFPRSPARLMLFEFAESLPSYAVSRFPELPPVKRLLRFAAQLTIEDDIDKKALDDARKACLDTLFAARKRLSAADPRYADRLREAGELEVASIGIEVGSATSKQTRTARITLSAENLNDIFERCGRALGVGEGLHKEFWKALYDAKDPDRAKLELIQILESAAALAELNRASHTTFEKLHNRNRSKIAQLPSSAREPYNRLLGATPDPSQIYRVLPTELTVRIDPESERWPKHLYADTQDLFAAKLNSWEKAVLEEELSRQDVVGWLRNVDRKDWSLAIPYDDRGFKPFFPDFIFIRKDRNGMLADIIDPHNAKLDDTWAKVKGLAAYANKHGHLFGRLEFAVVEGGIIKRLNVNDPVVRKKAIQVQSNNDIDSLFS